MNATPENKLSLDERIRQVRERRNRENQPAIKMPKRSLLNVEGELELARYTYINDFMDQLIETKGYSFRIIEVFKRSYIEYNIDMSRFIPPCKEQNDLFYYNAVLIYKMIENGEFDENDYLESAKLNFKNPIEVEKAWIQILNNKKENKE